MSRTCPSGRISSRTWSRRASAIWPFIPTTKASIFAQDFFRGSPNVLADLLPEFEFLSPVLRVIDVAAVAEGQEVRVVMDGERDMALGFLCDPSAGQCKP